MQSPEFSVSELVQNFKDGLMQVASDVVDTVRDMSLTDWLKVGGGVAFGLSTAGCVMGSAQAHEAMNPTATPKPPTPITAPTPENAAINNKELVIPGPNRRPSIGERFKFSNVDDNKAPLTEQLDQGSNQVPAGPVLPDATPTVSVTEPENEGGDNAPAEEAPATPTPDTEKVRAEEKAKRIEKAREAMHALPAQAKDLPEEERELYRSRVEIADEFTLSHFRPDGVGENQLGLQWEGLKRILDFLHEYDENVTTIPDDARLNLRLKLVTMDETFYEETLPTELAEVEEEYGPENVFIGMRLNEIHTLIAIDQDDDGTPVYYVTTYIPNRDSTTRPDGSLTVAMASWPLWDMLSFYTGGRDGSSRDVIGTGGVKVNFFQSDDKSEALDVMKSVYMPKNPDGSYKTKEDYSVR